MPSEHTLTSPDTSCSKSPLELLVQNLELEFSRKQPEGFYGHSERIRNLMTDYINHHNDWRDYVFYCPVKYTRNLIAKSDQFELMVICWRKGQPSPIHNHEDQRCWMGCVSGQLQETYFVYESNGLTNGTGALKESHVHPIENGSVGYITDEIALHMIESVDPESVSIHLYSKPILECNIYCPKTGIPSRRRLGYYTQYKQKIACNQLVNSADTTPIATSPQSAIPSIGDCSDS